MTPPDELERYETTEAQDLVRLLRSLNPPQESPVPAAFRTQVLARLAGQRQPWWQRLWLAPAWAPVGVGLLLLSVTLNVWWGVQTWEGHGPGGPLEPDSKFVPLFLVSPEATPWGTWALVGGLLVSLGCNGWLGYRLWQAHQRQRRG